MIILLCPECYSDRVTVYEGKMAIMGYDWFTCMDCYHNFPIKNASYKK